MYLSLGEILVVFLIGLAVVYFLGSIRVRELAVQSVRAASQRDDFQLLDQNVQLQRVSMSRDDEGRWRVWRQYRFDYGFDGVERRQGHVIMLGKRMRALVVAERAPDPGPTLH